MEQMTNVGANMPFVKSEFGHPMAANARASSVIFVPNDYARE
jgi:hypothetical protein